MTAAVMEGVRILGQTAEKEPVPGISAGAGKRLIVEVSPRRWVCHYLGRDYDIPLPWQYYSLIKGMKTAYNSGDTVATYAMLCRPTPVTAPTDRLYGPPLPTLRTGPAYTDKHFLGGTCNTSGKINGGDGDLSMIASGLAAFWGAPFTYWAGGDKTPLWMGKLFPKGFEFWELSDVDDVVTWPWHYQPSVELAAWAKGWGIELDEG